MPRRPETPLSIAIYASIFRGAGEPLSIVNIFSIDGPPKYCINIFNIFTHAALRRGATPRRVEIVKNRRDVIRETAPKIHKILASSEVENG